jgi:hypothetical protein
MENMLQVVQEYFLYPLERSNAYYEGARLEQVKNGALI